MAHLSDSKVQTIAEKVILGGAEKHMGIPVGALQTTRIPLDTFVSIEIDGYSEDHKVMVEVFSRIGKLAPVHYEKLANDILKLKLTEDKLKIPYKKYMAVCGEDAEQYLLGSSRKAYAAKYYEFGVLRIVFIPQ